MLDWLKCHGYLANWLAGAGALLASFVALGIATCGYLWRERTCRKNDSRLGVAIIDSFLEEVRNGLRIMEHSGKGGGCVSTGSPAASSVPNLGVVPSLVAGLPSDSWDGMSTIPDKVLLRIAATTDSRYFSGGCKRWLVRKACRAMAWLCADCHETQQDNQKTAASGVPANIEEPSRSRFRRWISVSTARTTL